MRRIVPALLLIVFFCAPGASSAVARPAGAAAGEKTAQGGPGGSPRPAVATPALARGEPEAREALLRDHGARVELAGLARGALAPRIETATAASPLSVGIWPGRPYQGALLVVDVAAPAPIASAEGSFQGHDLIWHQLDEKTWRAMGPVAHDAKTGTFPLSLRVVQQGGKAVSRQVDLEVLPLDWDTDELTVDPKFTKLSEAARRQVAADRKALRAMWKRGSRAAFLGRGNFELPRQDRTTAPFGTRRTYNGITRSVHEGWDIDGEVGAEIRAPNDGVVTMARDLYYSGGTLFLDHGGGLYTAYFHMDSFAVREGQEVKAGDLLGTVGATGRVTGPHLHWSARIGGKYIHPASLLLFDFTRPMVRPAGDGVETVSATR